MTNISFNEMEKFLYGYDDEKYLVNLKYDYKSSKIIKFKEHPEKGKIKEKEAFTPFLWTKDLSDFRDIFYDGDQKKKANAIKKYGIQFKELKGNDHPRIEDGYKYLFTSTYGFNSLKNFFIQGNVNPYKFKDYFLIMSPEEQFLTTKGKRLFKGFDTYNQIHKVAFDLETTGLDPNYSSIFLTGIKDNRGYEDLIKSDNEEEEKEAIINFFTSLDELNPTVVAGYNSALFDWYFIFKRAEILGINLYEDVFPKLDNIAPIKQRETFVKIGNETEDTLETTLTGVNVIDIHHSVKQTAAVDTNIKETNLKYITNYIGLKKENRVYVQHGNIADIWYSNDNFLFNDIDGEYFSIGNKNLNDNVKPKIKFVKEVNNIDENTFYCLDKSMKGNFDLTHNNIYYFNLPNYEGNYEKDKKYIDGIIKYLRKEMVNYGKIVFTTQGIGNELKETDPDLFNYLIKQLKTLKSYPDSFEEVSGQYIIKRYLMDDLWETLEVDYNFSQSAFLLSQIVPENFQSLYTMGTATLWNLLMINWSYYNNITIPAKEPKRNYVGGLSRMVNAGFSRNLLKFDFASLYPSTQLTWDIFPDVDISGVLKPMLHYFYDERFKAKHLMKQNKKEGNKELADFYDRKQAPLKIFINSLYGGLSAPTAFNWSEIFKGEYVTCVSRQCLRLMVKFFSEKGFIPLTMDSVTYDTPVYIKYENEQIDVLPIHELFDDNGHLDDEGKRDFSKKPFKILTKNGWKNIKYVYRHKTNKQIHNITTKDSYIKVTKDHSLFQNGKEIAPNSLEKGSKIDLYDEKILKNNLDNISLEKAWLIGFFVGDGSSVYKDRKMKRFSKRKQDYVENNHKRCSFTINNINVESLKKAQKIIFEEYNISAKLKDYRESSNCFRLKTHYKNISKWFSENCYTKKREKKIPSIIFESNSDIKKSFLDGLCCADGDGIDIENTHDLTQKSQVLMAGVNLLLKDIGKSYSISIRKDKENIISFRFNNKSDIRNDLVTKNRKVENKENYVYDISTEDGTFVCGINGIIAHNTDGCNFSKPNNIQEFTYEATGCHSMTEPGTYYGLDATVAEFNEKYMQGFMGLDIDGEWPSTINISRKNYALLEGDKIKLVGNTLKSKNLPEYISEFFNNGIKMLLNGQGKEFVEYYYDYLEKIYNQEIPLKKIAEKSKVKQSINDYLNRGTDVNGKQKGRQAHMEIAYALNLNVNIGDVIYYVNGGSAKSHGFVDTYKKGPNKDKFYAYHLPEHIVEQFPNLKGYYNVPNAIDAFNKRVQTLLIVFHPDVRKRILKKKPEDREFFTDNELELVRGYALSDKKPQDSYEFIMTPEEGENKFWEEFNERFNYNYNPNIWFDENFEFDLPGFISPLEEYQEEKETA